MAGTSSSGRQAGPRLDDRATLASYIRDAPENRCKAYHEIHEIQKETKKPPPASQAIDMPKLDPTQIMMDKAARVCGGLHQQTLVEMAEAQHPNWKPNAQRQGQILVRKSFAKRQLEMEAEEQAAIAKAKAGLKEKQDLVWGSYDYAREVREELLKLEAELASLKKAKADKQCLRDQLIRTVRDHESRASS